MTRILFTRSFIFLWVITAIHGSYLTYQKYSIPNYWKSISASGRGPDSYTNLSPQAIKLYQDYFTYDEYHKFLSYRITLDLEGFDLPESKEERHQLGQRALEYVLLGAEEQPLEHHGIERLHTGIKGLLSQQLLPQLVFTLHQELVKHNSIEGAQKPFQFNLNFAPETSPEFHFKKELSSGQVIQWEQGEEDILQVSKNESPALHESVFQTAIPGKIQFYQYHGGQITVWYNPQTKEGFIRFRRYLRSPDLAKIRAFIDTPDFKIDLVHFKSVSTEKEGAYPRGRFITSDIYQSFSLEDPKPRLEKAELYFGKLLPTYNYERNLAKLGYPYSDNVIETDELNIHGAVQFEGHSIPFETQIEKLTFDFNDQQFSTHSKLKTKVKTKEKVNKGRLQQKINHTLLRKEVIELIKAFELKQIYRDFKGGRAP